MGLDGFLSYELEMCYSKFSWSDKFEKYWIPKVWHLFPRLYQTNKDMYGLRRRKGNFINLLANEEKADSCLKVAFS